MVPTIDKNKTGIHLRKIMDERGFTVKDVQTYLGLGSVQSVYHWLNGISMPTVDNLYALSSLFQIPMDALVCGNRGNVLPNVIHNSHNAQIMRLQMYYRLFKEKCVA